MFYTTFLLLNEAFDNTLQARKITPNRVITPKKIKPINAPLKSLTKLNKLMAGHQEYDDRETSSDATWYENNPEHDIFQANKLHPDTVKKVKASFQALGGLNKITTADLDDPIKAAHFANLDPEHLMNIYPTEDEARNLNFYSDDNYPMLHHAVLNGDDWHLKQDLLHRALHLKSIPENEHKYKVSNDQMDDLVDLHLGQLIDKTNTVKLSPTLDQQTETQQALDQANLPRLLQLAHIPKNYVVDLLSNENIHMSDDLKDQLIKSAAKHDTAVPSNPRKIMELSPEMYEKVTKAWKGQYDPMEAAINSVRFPTERMSPGVNALRMDTIHRFITSKHFDYGSTADKLRLLQVGLNPVFDSHFGGFKPEHITDIVNKMQEIAPEMTTPEEIRSLNHTMGDFIRTHRKILPPGLIHKLAKNPDKRANITYSMEDMPNIHPLTIDYLLDTRLKRPRSSANHLDAMSPEKKDSFNLNDNQTLIRKIISHPNTHEATNDKLIDNLGILLDKKLQNTMASQIIADGRNVSRKSLWKLLRANNDPKKLANIFTASDPGNVSETKADVVYKFLNNHNRQIGYDFAKQHAAQVPDHLFNNLFLSHDGHAPQELIRIGTILLNDYKNRTRSINRVKQITDKLQNLDLDFYDTQDLEDLKDQIRQHQEQIKTD